MNNKITMTSSAVFLGLLGLALTFLPDEIQQVLNLGDMRSNTLVLQLLGALYFGFAMINWMAKGTLIGGIYNRPIAIGNFAHFFIGGISLVKAWLSNSDMPIGFVAVAIPHLVFAFLFWNISFRHPIPKKED